MKIRLLLLIAVLVGGLVLTGQPANAQSTLDFSDFIDLIDPDGEPCTGVPNQLPGTFDFRAACQAHDGCYVQGGDNSACDTAFRQNLLASCATQFPQATDPRRFVCQAFALLYYSGVVAYGQLT